ncbi:MAG: tetratricopeptide repeat protein [Candidatus Babeliales bacterium]|nr:tetratricopeptide repeat protein [Candidatus Babeliales bacterium]
MKNNTKKYTVVLFFILIASASRCLMGNQSFETLFNQATQEFRNNNYDQALSLYESSVQLNNQCHQAYFNMGLLHIHKQNYPQAIETLQKALAIDPQYAKAYMHLGIAYKSNKQLDKALEKFKKAIDINPQYTEALLQYARALNENSQFAQSAHYFKKALDMQKNDANTLLELANTLNMDNQTEQALQCYYQILKSLPNSTSILYNIAYTLKKLNRIHDSFPYYKETIKLEPNHSEAHFSLGLAYLAIGDFDNGWKEYEWRWKRDHNDERKFGKPLWDGSNIEGKTILIHAEQGLGDGFQFIRYAKMIKDLGARVIVAAHPPLVQFFGLCPYIDQVVSLFGSLPAFDVHVPMLTLPYCFKTRLDTVPHDIPYLYADPKLVASWKEKLSHNTNFKIGICWQGNSNYSTHFLRTAVAAKSVPITKFLPILTMPNVTVYNLQKITGEDQLKDLPQGTNFVCFDGDFDDKHGRFMDTAAVMKNLDLMITVDTSIAHLAGGLAIPVWCMLPEPADWRWMLKRTDTPWYPNMRLFRQPESGDWDTVINTITQELYQLVNAAPNLDKQLNELTQQIETIASKIALHEKNPNLDVPSGNLTKNMFELMKKRTALKKEIQKNKKE